jgi:hypothetical protein
MIVLAFNNSSRAQGLKLADAAEPWNNRIFELRLPVEPTIQGRKAVVLSLLGFQIPIS